MKVYQEEKHDSIQLLLFLFESPFNYFIDVVSCLLSSHLVDTATAIPRGSMKHIALVVW